MIGNYSAGRRRTPTVDELCIKTGRNRGGIMTVLEVLAKEEYIEWQRSDPGHNDNSGSVGEKGAR